MKKCVKYSFLQKKSSIFLLYPKLFLFLFNKYILPENKTCNNVT